jgi:pantoate kinase
MTLLEQIAQQRTNEVVYTSVAVTIEKIASEAAREILRDPAFKAELKLAAQRSIGRAFRDLRSNGRKPLRKTKRR